MSSDEALLDRPVTPLDDHAPHAGVIGDRGVPPAPRRVLIGEWLVRPLNLLWIAVLPQAVLLWINSRAYHLVSGEMDAAQRTGAAATGALELALLLGCTSLAVILRVRRQPLAYLWHWPLLAGALGYLAWVTTQFFSLLPATVPEWIVSGSELLYYQFVLTMPLAFYAGLRLACFESDRSVWRDLGRTLLVGVGLVALVLVASQALRYGPEFLFQAPVVLCVLLFVTVTLLLLGALMRALAIAYVGVRHRGPAAMAGLVFMVGIAGPLAGLWLNANIPFPVDLQSWEVYTLAVVNGLLLLLPNHRNPWVHRLVWLSQCALFSFSLYFFLVFLPLLPLCLPAMFALGAGVLMLVPSALFVVHSQRLVDGYRCEVRDGRRWVPAALGIGAALALPAVYIGGAWMDRVVLRGALDYAYTPSYRADATHFHGDPARVGRSLEHLRDYKAGLDLPFLTDLYKTVVFDGLVLPDEKMQHLYHVFLGRDLPVADTGRVSIFGHSAAGRDRGSVREAAPETEPPPPTASVVLAGLEQSVTAEGPCDRAHVTLTMANTGGDTAEFVTQVHLPEEVRVTGFWLHIGPERVPGRLVERKTALWVYHRIRDAVIHRDPGLLLYTGPETMELRVYPFHAFERRTVELELLYPAVLAPTIQVGERVLAPRDPEARRAECVVQTPTGDAGTVVTLTPDALAKLPSTVRRPYLHFLLDRSADSDVDIATLRQAVQTATARFPDAREGWLTTVNYDCREPLSAEPMPLATLSKVLNDERALAKRLSPLHGGFLQERAIRRGLLSARDQLAQSDRNDSPALTRYPVFIVVRGSRTQPMSENDEIGGGSGGGMKTWAKMVPDRQTYYFAEEGGRRLRPQSFDPAGTESPTDEQTSQKVTLLRCGLQTVACAATAKQPRTLRFALPGPDTSSAERALSVFDPQARAFQPVTLPGQDLASMIQVPPGSAYAHACEVFMRYQSLVEDPSAGSDGLTKVTTLSHVSGVLTGATSYIVVENSAQWRILEQKEKQKLANAPALEIEQTPEPRVWIIMVVGGLCIVVTAHRARSRRNPV